KLRQHPSPPPFPYTTLFRSSVITSANEPGRCDVSNTTEVLSASGVTEGWPFSSTMKRVVLWARSITSLASTVSPWASAAHGGARSEEHTSELQSRENLVCRL